MATVITGDCINCGACEPECPNTAIYAGGVQWELNGVSSPAIAQDFYYIVPSKCTECVGFYDHEACAAVCPVDCCVPDPKIPETEEVLIARAKQLHPIFAAGHRSERRTELSRLFLERAELPSTFVSAGLLLQPPKGGRQGLGLARPDLGRPSAG